MISSHSVLRPRRGFMVPCAAPIDLRGCIGWWVAECAGWWPKFIRCVSIEWCRGNGGIAGLCAVLFRLAMPNCAPAVELVITQPQYGHPSVTSPPCIRQRDRLRTAEDHGMPGQPICPPPRMPVTIRKAPMNFTNWCPSQIKEDHKRTLCVRPGN